MSLYSLVNSIVNSQNENEANKLLIGSNILLLNNREYYNAIISNFIQKKETIIKKENGKLVFDLNNTNDIWNIIFISEYIKENDFLYKTYNNLLLEIADIESRLSIIKNKHKTAKSKEEHASINTEYQNLNNVLQSKKNQTESMSGVLSTFYNTDWVNLINTKNKIEQLREIDILKQAVNIIHKIRNSLEHDNLDIDKVIELDNDNFKISIPIEYLDGFNKGRIIANNEDRIIVERTNSITLPLLSELDCDINSLQSIFYNIEPEFLSLLLEKYNYNVKDIYRLSRGVLENNQKTKELLNKGVSIEVIEKIPYIITDPFISVQDIVKMVNYLEQENLLDKISKINPLAFRNVDILDLYLKNGIDLDIINSFDFASFVNPLYAISLLEKVNLLKENGIEFSKLIKRFSNKRDANIIDFHYAEEIVKFVNRLKENNIPIEVLYDENILKTELFKDSERFKKIIFNGSEIYAPLIRPIYWFIVSSDGKNFDTNKWIVDELVKNGIKYEEIGIYGNNFEKLKTVLIKNNLYPMNSENNKVYILLEFLRVMEELKKNGVFYENVSIFENITYLVNNGVNIQEIDSISIDAIANAKKTMYFIGQNISFEEIKKIPVSGYRNIEGTIELIKFLKENNLSFEMLNDDLWKNPINTINLLKVIPKDKMNIVKRLSELSINDIDKTIQIVNKLIEYNIDIDTVSSNFIEGADDSISFIKWLETKKYDMKILEKLPSYAFFRFNEMDHINTVYYSTTSLKKYENLPDNGESYLEQAEKLIECLINNGYTIDKELPKKVFSVPNVKNQNIEYLLKLVSYEYKKLDEFPEEFYTCNFEILENMCKNYNYNLCKSIFGIGNSKLISVLIYGNSVFSQYQKEKHDDLLIDIDPITIIHAGFNTSLMYKNNINEWNQETYLTRFISNENEQPRDNTEIKKYILDKFRNACAHFRFKPVLDNQGNIVEDKIYIYDKYDESNETNFDIILDIRDFVEITRQVEKGLLQKKDEDFIIDEENRFKKR